MQKPFAQVGEEPDDFLVVGGHEDASVATLRPHLFLGDQLDLDPIPRPFRLAVGLPVDRDGGVDGIGDEFPEGHAHAVPIQDAVFVGLGKFLGERDAGPGFVGPTVLDDDPVVVGLPFEGLHLAGFGAVFEPVVAAEDDGIQLGPEQDVDGVLPPAAELPNACRASRCRPVACWSLPSKMKPSVGQTPGFSIFR